MQVDVKTIFQQRKSKDNRIEHFIESYDDWINCFDNDTKKIVELLLSHFDYYTHEEINEQLKELHLQMVNDYNIPDADAAHLFIKKKDGKWNSSLEYVTEYKLINKIDKSFFIEDVRAIDDEDWQNIKNIVIVDDCCGTGESLEKYLKYINRDFKGKCIYYIVIHALQASLDRLKAIEASYDVRICLVAANLRNKAFEYKELQMIDDAKDLICTFSEKKGLTKGYWLGFDDSQGVFAFYNNTPNNTIGLFWESNEEYKAIFPRDFGMIPSWKRPRPSDMKKKKQERQMNNYNARKENGKLY